MKPEMQTINHEFKEKIEQVIKMAQQIEIICERNLEETKLQNGKEKQNFSNQTN